MSDIPSDWRGGASHPSYGKLAAFIEAAILHSGSACLEWPYSRNARGYGQVTLKGKNREVHRVVCERAHGQCPLDKQQAAHLCGNRACVNPRHLRWATRKENEADKIALGRSAAGERNGHAKLTEDIIVAIRNSKEPQWLSAKRYNVGKALVSMIKRRKIWKHLP
jgi:hypothetical protein